MATEKQLIDELVTTLEDAVDKMNSSIPGIERDIQTEIDTLLKSLDTTGDTIKSNVANLRKIAAFKRKILTIIDRSDYPQQVGEFLQAFETVSIIQNKYFSQVSEDFKPSKLLEEVRTQSIESTLESLTESGLKANIQQPIYDILLKNSTTGGSYSELTGQLRDFLTTSDSGQGAMVKYVKSITTGSLNTYSAQYMNVITDDLGLEWFMYVGAIIKTSRAWCKACIKKKYIHRSEFQKLIDGNFPEFKEFDGKIYDKTGLPSGMDAGTNTSNLQINCGGRLSNCNHQMIPVSSAVVPKSIRDKYE